ncbi:MAG: hypothetical protein WCJ09_28790 [Planctomycetota bacterium]
MPNFADTNHLNPSDRRLYTVAEFRERFAAHQRAVLMRLAVCFAGMLGIYTVFGVMCQYRGPQYEWTPLRVLLAVCLIVLFLSQFLLVGGLIACLEHIRRRYRVKCEHCGKYLDVSDFNFAITIHCCPYCKNALFHEWNTPAMTVGVETADLVHGEFTLAEISEAQRNRTRAFGICLAQSAVAATIVFGITAGALWVWYDLLSTRFGDLAPHAANLIRLVTAFVVLGIGLFWSLFRTPGAFPKCGGCGSMIEGTRDTHTTGNCRTCGKRVIRDAPVLRIEESDTGEELLDRAEFNARINRYEMLSACSCAGVIGIGGLVWARLVFWWLDIQLHGQTRIIEIVAFMSGFGVLLLICSWIGQRLPKPRCPNCQQSLEGRRGLTQATGNCCQCGRRVLKRTESDDVN